MLGLLLLGSAAEAGPVDVASAIQPLLDDTLIATMDPALERVMHAPPFDQVVMQPAALSPAPWEEGFALEVLGTSVVRTLSGRLRMYYTLRWGGLNAAGVPVSHVEAEPEMFVVGIAESDNGVEWTKPLLDRPFSSKLNGANVSRSNILGLAGTLGGSTATVWVEPSAPASSRYRAVADGGPTEHSTGVSNAAQQEALLTSGRVSQPAPSPSPTAPTASPGGATPESRSHPSKGSGAGWTLSPSSFPTLAADATRSTPASTAAASPPPAAPARPTPNN